MLLRIVAEYGDEVSAIAPEAQLDAVHELLFGERKQVTRFDLVSALHCTSRREGPARATLALVLDGVTAPSSTQLMDSGYV